MGTHLSISCRSSVSSELRHGDPYWDLGRLSEFWQDCYCYFYCYWYSLLLWGPVLGSCFSKLYSASPRFHPCQLSVDKKSETLWSFRRLYYITSYYPSRQSLHFFKHTNNIFTFFPPLLNPVLFQHMPLRGLMIIKRHQQFSFRTMALVISSGCLKTEFCQMSVTSPQNSMVVELTMKLNMTEFAARW